MSVVVVRRERDGVRTTDFFMTPRLIRPHIRRIKKFLLSIKDHSMNRRVFIQFRILDILSQSTRGGVCGEDIQKTGVVVEWVSIDGIGGFLSR